MAYSAKRSVKACLSATARDIFDVLTARQEPGGLVRIRQQQLAERLGLSQSAVSRAIGQLRGKGIISERQRKGTLLIHPLLAGYESLAHKTNHLEAPDTHVWPINSPWATSAHRVCATGAPVPTSPPTRTRTAVRTRPPPRPGPLRLAGWLAEPEPHVAHHHGALRAGGRRRRSWPVTFPCQQHQVNRPVPDFTVLRCARACPVGGLRAGGGVFRRAASV
ncbi:helix-turn-helix transcriptional regulator [Streptomyces sp. NPDC102437]|uniref:helix-turn-helix transcriptional regulator n=1 Tax=Streptomyces sp. NPDC102437 TaxID=3366175 RepID=UPI0038020389